MPPAGGRRAARGRWGLAPGKARKAALAQDVPRSRSVIRKGSWCRDRVVVGHPWLRCCSVTRQVATLWPHMGKQEMGGSPLASGTSGSPGSTLTPKLPSQLSCRMPALTFSAVKTAAE